MTPRLMANISPHEPHLYCNLISGHGPSEICIRSRICLGSRMSLSLTYGQDLYRIRPDHSHYTTLDSTDPISCTRTDTRGERGPNGCGLAALWRMRTPLPAQRRRCGRAARPASFARHGARLARGLSIGPRRSGPPAPRTRTRTAVHPRVCYPSQSRMRSRHCSCNGVYAGQRPIAWMARMFSAQAYLASAVPLTLLIGQHSSCSPSRTRAQTAALAYLRVRKRREHPVTELHAALRQPNLDLGRILGRLRVRLSRGD